MYTGVGPLHRVCIESGTHTSTGQQMWAVPMVADRGRCCEAVPACDQALGAHRAAASPSRHPAPGFCHAGSSCGRAGFQEGADFCANFPFNLSGVKTENPGESGGASQPHTSSRPWSQTREGGATQPAVPLVIRPCALAWVETLPSALRVFSHFLGPKPCLLGFK